MQEESINQKQYCIDASFVLSILLPDEKHPQSDTYLDELANEQVNFIAPALLPYEVTNALRMAVIRKRVDKKTIQLILKDFIDLPIFFKQSSFESLLSFSLNYSVSVYDAAYLYTAISYNCELLTYDKKL